ncbi:hypothetical protein NCS52_00603400 [Fusarium sp. LHS14.1]|nr:hypothetical protein NCS52_00603400 [Fusarium sp. LHS14.1]
MTKEWRFVVSNRPSALKAKAASIRGHAACQGWKAHKKPRGQKRRRGLPPLKKTTYEYVAVDMPSCWFPPIEYQLGGGRVDPFRAYPGSQHPAIPALVDHYLVHMAVDIPELDQPGNAGLLRSSWFPLVISDECPFKVILLLAASNAVAINYKPYASCDLVQLHTNAIKAINTAFDSNEKRVCDALIGAVAKMASFEAMHGDVGSYRIHMEGLCKMIALRGGLDQLGLDGLLRRIVVWIDINSSFLLQIPRYFPQDGFAVGEVWGEPNPERFIAP